MIRKVNKIILWMRSERLKVTLWMRSERLTRSHMDEVRKVNKVTYWCDQKG